MSLIENRDYTVRRVSFPNRGNAAAVVDNSDGTFTIFLNTLYDAAAQNDALRHELNHLASGDFASALPIAEIEARAGAVALPEPDGGRIPHFASEEALCAWIELRACAAALSAVAERNR